MKSKELCYGHTHLELYIARALASIRTLDAWRGADRHPLAFFPWCFLFEFVGLLFPLEITFILNKGSPCFLFEVRCNSCFRPCLD